MREALDTNESSHRTRQQPTPESFSPLTCERGGGAPASGRLAAVGATAGGWPARDWSAPSSSAQIHPLLPQLRLSATTSGSVDAAQCLGRHSIYNLVDRLLRLLLALPVSTASAERAFSTLKIIKTRLRNTMEASPLQRFLSSSATAHQGCQLQIINLWTSEEQFKGASACVY
ncbi:uncharacterized protein [Triticum aestivum]|uniref:uncharacterized protein isoform X2 n=1 Tax=Triticum aestivum TaxID=4565 RepID=UPI001D016A92|nr:uncharacterized protein LOC123166887 isoform X2 [Triticum aestivum]